jgi:hypothetical protein
MATSGEFANLFAQELGIGRGTLLERLKELREADLVPTGGRGLAGAHFGVRPLVNWLLAACLEPSPGTVAKAVRAARALPKNANASRTELFGTLGVVQETTLGAALGSLLSSAVSGDLSRWKGALDDGLIVVEVVDGGKYVKIEAHRNEQRDWAPLVFMRPDTKRTAASAARIFRIYGSVFESLADILNRSERRDPVTGKIVEVSNP